MFKGPRDLISKSAFYCELLAALWTHNFFFCRTWWNSAGYSTSVVQVCHGRGSDGKRRCCASIIYIYIYIYISREDRKRYSSVIGAIIYFAVLQITLFLAMFFPHLDTLLCTYRWGLEICIRATQTNGERSEWDTGATLLGQKAKRGSSIQKRVCLYRVYVVWVWNDWHSPEKTYFASYPTDRSLQQTQTLETSLAAHTRITSNSTERVYRWEPRKCSRVLKTIEHIALQIQCTYSSTFCICWEYESTCNEREALPCYISIQISRKCAIFSYVFKPVIFLGGGL